MENTTSTGCCERFDPAPWDGKTEQWDGKLFMKGRVRAFMHIPLNFGGVCARMVQAAEAAGAVDKTAPWLSDENSLWGSDLYIGVTQDVPGQQMTRLSGRFMFKVYEGPYRDMPKWLADFKRHLKGSGNEFSKLFAWYTTCPKCAKVYGKNYVVLVAQLA